MTWDEVVVIAPQLWVILGDAIACSRDPNVYREWPRIRRDMERLVGFGAHDPRLRNGPAWSAAHDIILAGLETGKHPLSQAA